MKLSCAIIGAGNFCKMVLQRLTGRYGRSLSDEVKDIYLVDLDRRALKQRGEEFGIPPHRQLTRVEQLGEDVDFAVIATPATAHWEVTRYTLEKGIPTFISKPLDADFKMAKQMVELAESCGTLNAAGSQMLFHPALLRAIEFIHKKQVVIKHITINWTKERGPRDHPIPGIVLEEGPHSVGCLYALKQELPEQVHMAVRRGEIIISWEKWKNYNNRIGIRVLGMEEDGSKRFIVAETSKAFTALLKYSDGTVATVHMDFEDPCKQRTLKIIGELDGKRFERNIAIHVDMTEVSSKDMDSARHLLPGLTVWQGFTSERSGVGKVVIREEFPNADPLGDQLLSFIEYVRRGERPHTLMSFREELEIENLLQTLHNRAEYPQIMVIK
jgi:predicted dehydrogenase